jgi:hypothetical protein
MSFREKSAWITLVSVLICFGVYFGAIVGGFSSSRGPQAVALLVTCVGALSVLQIGLMLAANLTTSRDGRAPADERERSIAARSQALGYHVLMVLVMGLGLAGHLGHDVPDLLNFALLAAVLSVLTVAIAQIFLFLRGA